MTGTCTITLSCDPAPIVAAVKEFKLFAGVPAVFRRYVFDSYLHRLVILESIQTSAADAEELLVRLQPREGFRRVLAALRAGDRDPVRLRALLRHYSPPACDVPPDSLREHLAHREVRR